jgi:hypothetical protein
VGIILLKGGYDPTLRFWRRTGVPGRNAASVILKEFGASLEEVAKKA